MSEQPRTYDLPADVRSARDYEDLAARFLAAPCLAHIAGGSGIGVTVGANRDAFAGWAIYPRVLRDVRQGHTRFTLAGKLREHPVLLAPVAFQKLAHPQGEIAVAQAAEATDTCMVVATLSSTRLEDVSRASRAEKWFQLYFQERREDTLDLVRRAEAAGFTALVVTLDAPVQTESRSARRAGFRMPAECVAVNIPQADPAPVALQPGQSRIFQGAMAHAPTMADLEWLQGQTTLPLWAKGVLHADDARALQSRGVGGIVVSNHGGRGLDGAPASADALPAVRAAVGTGYPVLADGGIRSGSDIFKAIALGADAVLVGRLQMYALAAAGALGVAHMVRLLREELELCMALAGCATLADIGPDALVRSPHRAPQAGSPDADRH